MGAAGKEWKRQLGLLESSEARESAPDGLKPQLRYLLAMRPWACG